MQEIECPVEKCDYSTKTNRGLSIHASAKHPNLDYDFSSRETDTCDFCGEEYKYYPSRRNREGRKNYFCGRLCADKFKAKDGLDTECAECGDEIHVSPSHIKEVNGYEQKNYFCDKSCESSWKREHWTGENHHSWRGGSPSHRGANWTKQRRLALKRDGYACKVCSMTREQHYKKYGFDLDVHHKIPAKEFEQVEDANYQINLVTTCRSCHAKLDKISLREANRKPSIPV